MTTTRTSTSDLPATRLFFHTPAANILSGAPMLIDNNDPVGLNFTGNVEGMDLNKLDYEDFRRHQGVRHPRTAVALYRA